MNWEIFGIIAGIFTVSGFIPQIVKGYRIKKLDDLSYFLSVLICIGMSMWLVYGFHIQSIAVILSNIAGVSLNLILFIMKYKYSKR